MVGCTSRPQSVSIRVSAQSIGLSAERGRRSSARHSDSSWVSNSTAQWPEPGAVRAVARRLASCCRRFLFRCPGTVPASRPCVPSARPLPCPRRARLRRMWRAARYRYRSWSTGRPFAWPPRRSGIRRKRPVALAGHNRELRRRTPGIVGGEDASSVIGVHTICAAGKKGGDARCSTKGRPRWGGGAGRPHTR